MSLPTHMLALHLLGCVGFVVIVSMGRIARPLRRIWPDMLSCPMCFGVWGGSAWALALLFRASLPGPVAYVHDALAFAFSVSCLGFIVALADQAAGTSHKTQ